MPSEFALAREYLEQAWLRLSGEDETSVQSRAAIDLLIEAVAQAEYTKRYAADVLSFPVKASGHQVPR
ncbi:MAG: hypothetical protein K0S21_2266 [Rhizobiaceae bacterium]|jgi:hypothetical protein|nr:hypothetical protein [Rhizobiaceae bacterium]